MFNILDCLHAIIIGIVLGTIYGFSLIYAKTHFLSYKKAFNIYQDIIFTAMRIGVIGFLLSRYLIHTLYINAILVIVFFIISLWTTIILKNIKTS